MIPKPLLWGAAAGVVTGLVLLTTRRAGASPTLPAPSPTPSGPDPMPKTYGEQTRVPLAVPAAWRRVTNAEVAALPELREQASALRSSPGFTSLEYGTMRPFTASDGKLYATWVEQHYHEPGGSVRPWGLHHGVTLLARR